MDSDSAWSTVGGIVRYAQAGHQYEALGQLLELSGSDEPLLAWLGAAACLPGMCWSDEADSASDMVMRIVERFGHLVDDLELPGEVGFVTAVVAGGVYDDLDIVPRLFQMASYLRPGSLLHDRALWVAGHVAEHGGEAALPLNLGPSQPLAPDAAKLAARRWTALTDREVRRLWLAAVHAADRELLLRLWDSPAVRPMDHTLFTWQVAQVLFEAGRTEDAEQALVASATSWYPFASWETLPLTPVLNPGLRPALTERVTDAFWRKPIGLALVAPAS